MRTIITFFFVIVLTLCIGCNNDNSTGNDNNPPATRDSLIASFDSLSVTNFAAPYQTSFSFADTSKYLSFKIVFEVIANLDTTNGSFLKIESFRNNDTVNFYTFSYNQLELNNLSVNKSFAHSTISPFYHLFYLKFGFNLGFPQSPDRYIKVKNLKLYAVINQVI